MCCRDSRLCKTFRFYKRIVVVCLPRDSTTLHSCCDVEQIYCSGHTSPHRQTPDTCCFAVRAARAQREFCAHFSALLADCLVRTNTSIRVLSVYTCVRCERTRAPVVLLLVNWICVLCVSGVLVRLCLCDRHSHDATAKTKCGVV